MDRETVIRNESVWACNSVYLTYTLTERRDTGGETLYSLSVTELACGKRETTALPDLTGDRKEAERLFILFYENTVTPCTAEDVLIELVYTP